MIIDKVIIQLSGKYSLDKLDVLNYHCHGQERYFDGVMHRYIFKPIDDNHVEISIFKKPSSDMPLIPHITFHQIQDWVGQSIDFIERK